MSDPGAWVLVAGPSGAGKDTVMRAAHQQLSDPLSVQLARRVVTRQQNAFEDHDTVSEPEFLELRDSGKLVLHWQAHGLYYGINQRWQDAVNDGCIIIANVSRTILPYAAKLRGHVITVLVTAPSDILAARIATRGRESASGERLSRRIELAADWQPYLVINNTGTPEEGAAPLVALLQDLIDGEIDSAAPA